MPKICIYGVGAIGGLLAARLALSGYPVTGIARGAQRWPRYLLVANEVKLGGCKGAEARGVGLVGHILLTHG